MHHYQMLRTMKKEGYSMDEVNEMLPYEKDVFAMLITNEYKEKQQEQAYGRQKST